jgi:demethylmenaquinone methyltransferase/2-methoxy-6-polyprenyl-1,4-benzoquinol methylase
MYMHLEYKKKFVKQMFDDIHGNYDFLNTLLSFGQDRRWRKKAVKDIPSSALTIDLCAGGGQLAYMLLSRRDFAGSVILADIAPNMLKHSRRILSPKFDGRFFPVVCDVEKLPFRDCIFNGAISAFSLRNLSDLKAFSGEIHRLLNIDGKVRLLEIGHPKGWLLSAIFELYFYKISPFIADLFTSKKYAYRYLPNSLKAFPPQHEVVKILGKGWAHSSYQNILGGIAAIYSLSNAVGAWHAVPRLMDKR